MKFKAILSNEKGDAFIGIMLQTLFMVTLVLTVINTYALFWKYQNVLHVTRSLVRYVELAGSGENVISEFNSLLGVAGLDPVTTCVSSSYDKIQIRDPFTVTVSSPYTLNIFGAQGNAGSFTFQLKCQLQGISEVYWKELAGP